MNRIAVVEKQLKPQDEVKIIKFSNPPQNTLNYDTRVFLMDQIKQADEDPLVKAVVICSTGTVFSAGADINEFTEAGMKEPYLPDVLDRVEACKKLVIAAVQGVAIGGGCELALASHLRVVSQKSVFSLPEIRLGIIPGGGGTQRLPRAVGVQQAIEIACSGKNVKADKAKKIGLVDLVADGDVVEAAVALAKDFIAKKGKIRRLCEDNSKLGNCIYNAMVFRTARKEMTAKLPTGMISPLRCLDAIEAATKARTFADGMKRERDIFVSCAKTPQAAALKHMFFSIRAASRPSISVNTDNIQNVGIIGGGTMGSGIAICFLKAGFSVTLLETTEERKKFCVDSVTKIFEASAAKKKLTAEKMQGMMSKFNVVVDDYPSLGQCDYVVEAVFESMALKKEIFAKLDAVCKPSCVLATNTSTLSVDEIAKATTRPSKVIGAHFFSPANVMPLLEFVRGAATSEETVAVSLEIGKRIRKTCVVVGNCFGFVSNRMILRGGFQALAMLEEGCFPREIDSVIKRFGFPVGPFAMQDIAGLDVAAKIRLETPKEFIPARDVSTVAESLVKDGRYGQKTSKGWYLYDPKAPRTPVPDYEVEKLIVRVSDAKKVVRRHVSNEEITQRYLYAMINEAALILEQKFATRPSDVDVVFVFGFGFPFTKGGPCHYADSVGIDKVVETMNILNKALGPDTFPAPCELLQRLAANKQTFASLN